MLDKLMQHFKHAMTTSYSPNDSTYEWFQTELGQTFGILKSSLSETEKNLLSSLFQHTQPLSEEHLSVNQQKWVDFLFYEKQIIPSPLPSDQSGVRFYYFYLTKPIDDKQSFEEAVQGILNSDLVLWLSYSHGIIIEEKPTTVLEIESLKNLSDTLTSDFFVEPFLYIGQLQKNDSDLRVKFKLEHNCFQALHHASNRERVVSFYEALPLLVLKTPSKINKDLLSNHLVEALEDNELIHTIEAFLQSNLNASSTAKRLFIHRNSLQYRLEKLLEKTGLDIRIFSTAAFIFLAITIVRLKD
ncbi:PucR family transcriptional regulator [Metabacillus litoralis]|uniref:PucR family transcriptional regulator n=1 Tax=Metabacillus litoralis TaxID=152268 RepID=UPI001CFE0AE6|nr:helix-turn-helix domain-containing protein [Metabacillus litoralis]